MMRREYFAILLLALPTITTAQNDRVNDYNNTNWFQVFTTIGVGKKLSTTLEYQARRADGLKNAQQDMVRAGITYNLNEQVSLQAGYAFVETYPYGDFPIASAGKFPEHRVYEQLQLKQLAGKFQFTHRFRVEQRWIGVVRQTIEDDREIETWNFVHRFRYQFRTQYSLYKKDAKQLYLAAADEIFVGAGKNVGTNIFDQNRLFVLLGYRFSKTFAIEAGYFNQTLQQGRRINNSTIIQRNNGAVLSSFINL